jgi:hypothetical protein
MIIGKDLNFLVPIPAPEQGGDVFHVNSAGDQAPVSMRQYY